MNAVSVFGLLKMVGTRPRPFGVFHLLSLILVLLVSLAICRRYKTTSEKEVRRILFILSLLVIVLEVYKQVVFSVSFDGEVLHFDYDWHIFPWQFCSTPMFAGMAASVIKNNRIHYMLCCYLSSYGLVAGLLTMATGSSLFSNIIGVNIQTMICHGSMVVIGVFLLSSGYVKADSKALKAAIPLFLLGAVIAMVLNQAAFLLGIPEGEVFNMYFISPYFPEDQPLFLPIRKVLPDPIFQIVYLVAFTGIAHLTLTLFGKLRRH